MNNSEITQREKTIAHRYASGETYKEIASALYISPATVRNHMANVYRKLGVKNKSELLFAISGSGITTSLVKLAAEEKMTPVAGASIAIMPLKNCGDSDVNHLIDGVTANIHNCLTRHHDLFVSARSSCSAMSLKDWEFNTFSGAMVQLKITQYVWMWSWLREELGQ